MDMPTTDITADFLIGVKTQNSVEGETYFPEFEGLSECPLRDSFTQPPLQDQPQQIRQLLEYQPFQYYVQQDQLPLQQFNFQLQPSQGFQQPQPNNLFQLLINLSNNLQQPNPSPSRQQPVNVVSNEHGRPRRREDYTKVFLKEFQALVNQDSNAKKAWIEFRKQLQVNCTYDRCIRVNKAFCGHYGDRFANLCTDSRFKRLGTRSHCACQL